MFKLSCFHTSTLSAKQRKTVQLSSEPLQNTADDILQTQVPNSLDSDLSNTMVKGGSVENFAEHATDSCAVEFDEETESKNSIDRDILVRSGVGMKKCHSLGCFLDRNETGNVIAYEDEVKESYSDESHDNLGLVDRDDELSCEEKSGNNTPRSLTSIVKSVSLPYIASRDRSSRQPLFHSRSAEDLQVLDSRQKLTSNHEGETSFLKDQEDRSLVFNEHGGDNIENPIDYSANDLVVPVGDEVGKENDRSRDPSKSDDLSSRDFTKKRIEEWVLDLQECSHLEASSDLAAPEIIEVEKYDSYTKKEESKVNSPSMEAARKYITSLPSSATSAQLINLGLVTIPFLSPIYSLRALNLSGNAIVRITAGALPRGLHVLNLSKNNIATIEGLRDLTRLRVLDLSYNRILRIGHGLASCSSLKELYLAGNKISEVEGLHRLLKLNVLDLQFNKISTTKCLGQLAANYLTLQVISLEGNPAQKNVGDEQLKKYLLGLLPNLVYFNRKPIKVGSLKDRLSVSAHQNDRSIKADVKNIRKGIASSSHVRKSQPVVSSKPSSSRRLRLVSTGSNKVTTEQSNLHELSNKLLNLKSEGSVLKSRSVGNLAEL